MKRIYILSFVFAATFSVFNAKAQNLDPTVEVSRAYEGKLMEIHKPVRDVNVPDSVSTFRLDFDYSVFENPYRGAYEFNPYFMSMRPSATTYDPKNFYLKVGTGYRLYPELDLIWSPTFKGGFSMDVYANHKSYVGDYRGITLSGEPGGVREFVKSGETWNGYDLMSKAGVNGRYAWKTGNLDFNANYYGLAGKTVLRDRCYDAVDARLALSSNKNSASSLIYSVELKYRFAEDKLNGKIAGYLQENLANADACVGYIFNNGDRLLVDFGGQFVSYQGGRVGNAGKFYVTPHYAIVRGRWSVDAGLKVDMIIPSHTYLDNLYSAENQQYVYPDIKARFNIIQNALSVYAAVTGGTKMNTYATLLSRNHHADFTYGAEAFDSDIDRVRTSLGFRGRIGRRFSYDVRGGYALFPSSLLPSVVLVGDELIPGYGYASIQKAYASLDWRWDTENFKFDGTVTYNKAWDCKNYDYLIIPPKFTGNAAFEYNWKRRVFVGVDCEFATARLMPGIPEMSKPIAVITKVPAWVDLGVSAEYALNRKLSFWLRGGNLCCMTIQRTPLYAEGGISFTAGICLNL